MQQHANSIKLIITAPEIKTRGYSVADDFYGNHDTSWTVASWVNLLINIHVKIIWFLKMNGLLSDNGSHFFVMWLWIWLLKVNYQTHYKWIWVLLRWSTLALKTPWCSSCFTSLFATSGGKLTFSPALSPVEVVSVVDWLDTVIFNNSQWFEWELQALVGTHTVLCIKIWNLIQIKQ